MAKQPPTGTAEACSAARFRKFELEFIEPLERACAGAKLLASRHPGLYGGVYVARKDDAPYVFVILTHDDPDRVKDDEDVYAHVTANKVYPIGAKRYFLNQDGSVDRDYFQKQDV